MNLRICFEPHKKMEINDIAVFKYYGGNYLADFNVEFGGYISMDAKEKVCGRFEPVWQFLMFNVTDDTIDDFLKYIGTNPMNGYYVHVYKDCVNSNEIKIV